MVKGNIAESAKDIYDYLLDKLDAKDNEETIKGIDEMIKLFNTDIEKFYGLFGYQKAMEVSGMRQVLSFKIFPRQL